MLPVCIFVILNMLGVTGEFELAQASPYATIDVDTAHNMITNGSYPDLVLLDVRTKSEYDSRHIYGAVWIPVAELEARIDELAGHEGHEIIVYCLSGIRSATASGTIDSENFTKVYNMFGGISAWELAGYPTWIATVHNLNSTHNYDTIQAAIDANQTLDGHTIFVEEGIYYENIVVDKSLSLIGENMNTTVIDGNHTENVITIAASSVNITFFTLQKGWVGMWPYFQGAGVFLAEGTSGNNISYNLIIDNGLDGIRLNASSNNVISHNFFLNNNGSSLTALYSSDNIISDNLFSNCVHGINIVFSSNNTIFENTVLNNFYGIMLVKSGSNSLFDNNMTDNYRNFGIHGTSPTDFNNSVDTSNLVNSKSVYYLQDIEDVLLDSQLDIGTLYLINCDNVTVKDLSLSNNSYGLLLWETSNSKIENLTIEEHSMGIDLGSCINITISGNSIMNNGEGIWLNSSNSCRISENNIEATEDRGIRLELSSNNSILNNNITSSRGDGIVISGGANNHIIGNSIIDNKFYGLVLFSTSDNKFYHNNFVGNKVLILGLVYANYWNNTFEGNYWKDYNGSDLDHNGIGDTPYRIDENNTDYYPLMGLFSSFNTSLGKNVNIISNSSIEGFEYELSSTIRFYVSNLTLDQSVGFCRVTIPKSIVPPPYDVVIDDGEVDVLYYHGLLEDNGTHRWIYFKYEHFQHKIEIIPEFPSILILPLFIVATLLTVTICRRKHCQGIL